MTRICIWQQHPAEDPGRIETWSRARGCELDIVFAWEGDFDAVYGCEALIVLGGPYSADDGQDWLQREFTQLRRVLQESAIPVLGICLGAQILARVLGGDVVRMPAMEAGWCKICFADGASLDFLQWHEYAILPPENARTWAGNQCWPCQAFVCDNRHVGLQFHPEWDRQSVQRLNAYFSGQSPLPRDGNMSGDAPLHALAESWLFAFLDQWLSGTPMPHAGVNSCTPSA